MIGNGASEYIHFTFDREPEATINLGLSPDWPPELAPTWHGRKLDIAQSEDALEADWQNRVLRTGLSAENLRIAGSCREADPDSFYPESDESPDTAKRVCGRCVLKAECLVWALENNEKFGIWGGMTPDERRALQQRAAS